jgi:hypothetical protein
MEETLVRVRRISDHLVREVRRIATNPVFAGDDKAKEEVKTLAKAVVELTDECDDLCKALETLLKNATFKKT